jgi:hypothetical protein
MIAVKKSPFPDHAELHVKNYRSETIVDIVAMSAGLDMAIDSIKDGNITKATRQALRDLVGQTYILYSRKIALGILKEEGLVDESVELSTMSINFDLPDEEHDDLVIYYKQNKQ